MVKVVVGWAIASSLFLAGWLVGVAKHRRTCEETLVRYARRVVQLEDALAARGGPAMAAEVEQYLQENDP